MAGLATDAGAESFFEFFIALGLAFSCRRLGVSPMMDVANHLGKDLVTVANGPRNRYASPTPPLSLAVAVIFAVTVVRLILIIPGDVFFDLVVAVVACSNVAGAVAVALDAVVVVAVVFPAYASATVNAAGARTVDAFVFALV